MIPPPRRGRCAGRGQAQQSLPACRYSGHGSPLPRMAALRAHLLDSCPPVRGSHHGAPLGDEATAGQSGSPRTWLHRVSAHPTEQAPPATLGDRSAPGRSGRRRRAGSRPPSARYGPCSRAGAVTPPAPHGHATAASTGARRSRASRREPSIPNVCGEKARRRFPSQGSIYFRYPPLPARTAGGAYLAAPARQHAGAHRAGYRDAVSVTRRGGQVGRRVYGGPPGRNGVAVRSGRIPPRHERRLQRASRGPARTATATRYVGPPSRTARQGFPAVVSPRLLDAPSFLRERPIRLPRSTSC